MLRVAVPNKGSLSASACDMLREAGYHQRTEAKELVVLDAANHVEFFYLRPRDIATFVGSGRLDIGITGRDLLADCDAAASEVLALGFARSAFHFAATPGAFSKVHDLESTSPPASPASWPSTWPSTECTRARSCAWKEPWRPRYASASPT